MKEYRHIFFDLDRTLWNYEANSRETLQELLHSFGLNSSIDPLAFFDVFHRRNEELWLQYGRGDMDKETLRFNRIHFTFLEFGIDDKELSTRFSEAYTRELPLRTHLAPEAPGVLSYLQGKYNLYILSNGFRETQLAKIERSGMAPFFLKVFTSDNIGVSKPHAGIFHYALTAVNARKTESLMVGDDLETDIMGAARFGIDQVYINLLRIPHSFQVTYEIQSLPELKELL